MAGPIIAWVSLRLLQRIENVPSAVVMQFITTFGVWVFAERVGLSGVLTIVCYAIAVAREAPRATPARIRVPSYAVWETAVFVLNVLAFVLIGLQIRPIMEALDPGRRLEYLVIAGAVLAAVIAVRVAWVMALNTGARAKIRWFGFHPPRPMTPPTARGGLVISWSGMRGIVTLAAALALPVGEAAFPFRDLIVFTAFCVVLGTLVLQGLTLRPLVSALRLHDDDPVGREVRTALSAVFQAALRAIDGDRSPEADALRREYEAMLHAEHPHATTPPSLPGDGLRRRAVAAGRTAVARLRDEGRIGDDAFHQVEEALDRAELSAAPRPGG